MPLVALNASPSDTSTTHALAAAAVEEAGEGSVLDLGTLDAEALLGRRSSPDVTAALEAVASAGRLVVCTPVYRATYSGLLKVLFDQLPDAGLRGVACVLMATGGGPLHYLSIDTGLRSLVASLSGWAVPTVVYATRADRGDDGRFSEPVLERVRQALAEASSVGA